MCKDQSVRNGNFNSALSTLRAEWDNKESDNMAAQMKGEKHASSAWPQITCTTGVIKPFVGDISSCISAAGIVFMLSVCLRVSVCHHGKKWSQHQLWEELQQRQLWGLRQAYKNLTLCVWTQQCVVKDADTQLCSCVVVIKIKTSSPDPLVLSSHVIIQWRSKNWVYLKHQQHVDRHSSHAL